MKVKNTERGWAGHFCGARECLFRRNTLIENKKTKIVISTVGNYISPRTNMIEKIGCDRYYETMAFEAKLVNGKYWDADVSKEVYICSKWAINKTDMDNEANEMHEKIVNEIQKRMEDAHEYFS